jgi:hypothetical protein
LLRRHKLPLLGVKRLVSLGQQMPTLFPVPETVPARLTFHIRMASLLTQQLDSPLGSRSLREALPFWMTSFSLHPVVLEDLTEANLSSCIPGPTFKLVLLASTSPLRSRALYLTWRPVQVPGFRMPRPDWHKRQMCPCHLTTKSRSRESVLYLLLMLSSCRIKESVRQRLPMPMGQPLARWVSLPRLIAIY